MITVVQNKYSNDALDPIMIHQFIAKYVYIPWAKLM